MNRRVIIAGIAVLAVLVGLRAAIVLKSKRGAKEAAALFPVTVLTVAPTDYDEILELSGTMVAENQTDVPAKVQGKIIKYLFEEGAWVERGQTVVTINRDEVGVEFKEAVVESPISGWLTRRYFDAGTQVLPSGPMTPGTPLFQIADYRRVKLVVSVPESDISKVRPGQQAAVSIDAWPDQSFAGTVRKVSPTVDYLSRTVKAEVALANAGLKLRPGMYGRAVVRVKHHSKGVVIPTTAILERDQGAQVFVVAGNKAVARQVTVELDMGEASAVKSGLNFGDKLIVAGQHSVTDGSPVEIVGGK